MTVNTHPKITVTDRGLTVEKDPHTAPIHIPASVLAANSAKVHGDGPLQLMTITLMCHTLDVQSAPAAMWAPEEHVVDQVVAALTAAGFTVTPPSAVGTIESGLLSVTPELADGGVAPRRWGKSDCPDCRGTGYVNHGPEVGIDVCPCTAGPDCAECGDPDGHHHRTCSHGADQ